MNNIQKTYFLSVRDKSGELMGYLEHDFIVPADNIPGRIYFYIIDGIIVVDELGDNFFTFKD